MHRTPNPIPPHTVSMMEMIQMNRSQMPNKWTEIDRL